jgi:hypothetical protein
MLSTNVTGNDDYPCGVDKVDGIDDAKKTYDEWTTGRTCKSGDGAEGADGAAG